MTSTIAQHLSVYASTSWADAVLQKCAMVLCYVQVDTTVRSSLRPWRLFDRLAIGNFRGETRMLLDTARAHLDLQGNRSASDQPRLHARRLLGVYAALIMVCALDFKAESSGTAALFQGSVYLVSLFPLA